MAGEQNSRGSSFQCRSSLVEQWSRAISADSSTMREEEEAHCKQECRGQCGDADNEPWTSSPSRLQSVLIRSRRVESTHWRLFSCSSTENNLPIVNQREGINSKNIWTIYSNTLWIVLEAGGQRAVVENGQWRHGKDSQAVHCYFFSLFFCHGLPKWLWFTQGPIDN